jgi:hypothetical protein
MADKLYSPPERRAVVVDVPEMSFLMVEGTGAPGGPEFRSAVASLFKASYAIHLRLGRGGRATRISPLEGLWDLDWSWTAMICQPDEATPGLLRELKLPPALRLERFHEGLAIQTLHVGPFADEDRAVGLLAAYADEHGYVFSGRHHEIYLSDPRRTRPERLRTIIRHPVAHATSSATWASVIPTEGSVRMSSVGA